MSAYVVFLTAGEYSDRSTVPVMVCCDLQVAEAIKAEIEAEIARLEAITEAEDRAEIWLVWEEGGLRLDNWTDDKPPVKPPLNVRGLSGFRWTPARKDGTRWGGEIEVVITEVDSLGPIG